VDVSNPVGVRLQREDAVQANDRVGMSGRVDLQEMECVLTTW
jgi:hypothetical protein